MPNNTTKYTDLILRSLQADIKKEFAGMESAIYATLRNMTVDKNSGSIADVKRNKNMVDSVVKDIKKRYSGRVQKQILTSMRNYSSMLTEYIKYVEGLGYEVDSEGINTLSNLTGVTQISKWAWDRLGGDSDLISSDVKKALEKSIISDVAFDKTVNAIGGKYNANTRSYEGGILNKGKHYAYTIANTGLITADRVVGNALYEQLGIEWFEYGGNVTVDKVTRPFCYAILKKLNPNSNGEIPYGQKAKNFQTWLSGLSKFTTLQDGYIHISEIQALDNKQLPRPLDTGGGYNCRHEWEPALMSENQKLIEENPELNKIYRDGRK